MRPFLVLVLLSVVVGACGGSSSANRCPNNPPHCLTNEVCSYDQKQGCQVCHCDQPPYDPIGKENPPSGTPPPGQP